MILEEKDFKCLVIDCCWWNCEDPSKWIFLLICLLEYSLLNQLTERTLTSDEIKFIIRNFIFFLYWFLILLICPEIYFYGLMKHEWFPNPCPFKNFHSFLVIILLIYFPLFKVFLRSSCFSVIFLVDCILVLPKQVCLPNLGNILISLQAFDIYFQFMVLDAFISITI